MPIPGDPDAVLDASQQLSQAATALASAHDAVLAHGRAITVDWSGLAAPLALARIEQDAADVQHVAEATNQVVGPLATYADELRSAQADYAHGEHLLEAGRTALTAASTISDADRARQSVDDATSVMNHAEERALVANETAARAFAAAGASLDGLVGRAPPPAGTPAGGLGSPLAEMGNSLISTGNAALHHPLDGLAVLGGGALATVGVLGVVGSLAADATGAGAVVGVPVGGASLAAATFGVGLAGAGLLDIATHAAGDNRVTPFQVDAASSRSEMPPGPITDTILEATEEGRQKDVRQVDTDDDVRRLAEKIMEGGTPLHRPGYPGRWVTAPDGTQIGLRESSASGGPTIDVKFPNGDVGKVHRR